MDFESYIREIPDFPKEGILFKDITTLLKKPGAFAAVIEKLAARYENEGIEFVVGIEARGFIFGGALAIALGTGFIPIRKPGKLPAPVYSAAYSLEYGEDRVEMHKDAIPRGSSVLLVDDLLATGGTAAAAVSLLEETGAVLREIVFLIELTGLEGRRKLTDHPIYSMIMA